MATPAVSISACVTIFQHRFAPSKVCSMLWTNTSFNLKRNKCYNLNVSNVVGCIMAICTCGTSAVLADLQPVQYAALLLGFEMCQVELSADILNTKEILAYNYIIQMCIWIEDTAACALCILYHAHIPKYVILHSYIGTYLSYKYANEVSCKLLSVLRHFCNKR